MAKLPCIPQSRIFTLKETGETMSYDQVREYLMSNPELWLGKGEAKAETATNTPEGIASRIRNKKQKGALSAIDFGISVTIYNGALEFMAAQVEKGTKLGNAIANTIKWIDDKMKGEKWNKDAFEKAFKGSPEVKPVTEVPIGKPIKKTETDLLVRARPNDILNNLDRYSLKELVTLLTQNDREGEYWQYLDTEEFPNKSEALAEARKDVARIFEGFDLFELQQRQNWMDLTQTEEVVSPFAVTEASKKKIGKTKAKELTRQEVELISEEKRMGAKIVPGLKFENIEGQRFEVVDVNRSTGDVTFKNLSDYEGYWKGTNTTNPIKNNYFDYLFYHVSEPTTPEQKEGKEEDRVEKFLKDLYWKEGGLGMNAGLWNAAVTTMLKAYRAGKTVYEAIQAGIEELKAKGENIKDYQAVIDKATEMFKKEAEKEGREIGTPIAEKPITEKPPVTPPLARPITPSATEEREIRERKTITSIKEATDISDQVKEALGGERTRYEVLPNTVSVAEANAILNAIGTEKAKEMVLTANKQMPSAFRTTLAQVLIKQYNKEGKFRDAVDVAEGIAEIATDWGQGIQALSLFEFLTPEGQLLAAQREVDRQRNKRFQAEGEKIKKVRKAFKKADDEAIEGAIESVVSDTDKTAAPAATRKPGWGEKNKIVTKAIYEAAKKALKKFAFTGVPPELVTIAAYHIEAGARSFADFSKEMVKDFGRKVKPYLKAAYKAAQKKVGGLGYSTDAEIATHMAADIEKDIRQVMKESGVKIRELIRQHYSEAERTKEALTKALVDKLGLDPADAALIAEKVNKEYNRIATDKKQKALDAIERRLLRKSPTRKKAEEKLIELSNLGAFDEGKFKEDYAKAMGFPELTEKDAAAIKELAEKVQQAPEGRPKQKAIVDLLNYQANIKGMSEFEVGTAIWMAAILSGPVTQAKNIFGNVFNMSTLLFDMAITNPKDLPFILKGLAGGLGNGFMEAGTTLITGYPPMKLRNEAMGILERAHFNKYSPYRSLKYVTRFMLASDALTYGGLREMRAYQKALAEARENYPSVNAVQKAIEILGKTDSQIKNAQDIARQEYSEEVARIEADASLSKAQKAARKKAAILERYRRIYDLIEQSRPDFLVTDSHEYAAKGTFTNPPTGTLGVGARFLNGVKHNIPISSFAIPFTNTIANVANNTINYTPLGYARAYRGGSILMGRQKEFTEDDRARMVRSATLGMAAAAAAYILSSFGGDDEDEEKNWFRITAEGYGDYKKNKELEATGWKPYSIKMGNTWYSYQLTPLMGILSAVGAIRDYEKYHKKKLGESDMNKIVLPMQVMLSTIAESSYLSSVEGFLSAILDVSRGDKGQKFVDWITKTVTPFVPLVGTNFYQQNAQMIQRMLEIPDKEFRGTYFGKMLRTVPYARDQYFNVVNGLGEEVKPPRMNVIYSKPEGGEYDKLWQLLVDKNQVTGRPERRGASYVDINGEQKAMTDEQFYLFVKTRGEYIRNLMLANYDSIKEMDKDEFAKWMQGVRSGANRWANDKLALQFEKGIYEESVQPYTAEASHERDRIMYAIEIGDVQEAKSAFENYEKLSPKGAGKDKKELFVEIVDDKIAPTGIKPADRLDFYKAVMLDANPNIKIQQMQDNGKVKMMNKPFNEIFTEEERSAFKSQYMEQEKIVSRKLEVLDEVLKKDYSQRMGGEAIWRRYVKRANKQ